MARDDAAAPRRHASRRGGPRRAAGPDGPTPGSAADDAPDADPESVARAICLRQLTLGPRSRAQLEQTLRSRAVDGDVAERVLDRLGEVGLVDDAAYAESFVRSRVASKGLARRALAHELRGKGVADDVAAAALAGLDPDEERDTARALVERKVAATRGLTHEARVRRLAGMLGRKGYPPGVALAVVREALAGDAEGVEGEGADGDVSDGARGELSDDAHAC